MQSRLAARASVAAAAFALVLSGCTRSTDFSITKTFRVNAAAGVTYSASQDVDLAAEAGGAWKQRNHIKSLSLVGIDATMTNNVSGATTTGSGSIVLSRAGLADVTVGTWTNETINATPPDSIAITLNAAGAALIEDAIKGDGRFTVKVSGTMAAARVFDAEATLHLHMTYKFP